MFSFQTDSGIWVQCWPAFTSSWCFSVSIGAHGVSTSLPGIQIDNYGHVSLKGVDIDRSTGEVQFHEDRYGAHFSRDNVTLRASGTVVKFSREPEVHIVRFYALVKLYSLNRVSLSQSTES
jgi:hypothetical protein